MSGFSEKQMQILKFPYMGKDALICDGAVRSGKTSVMSLSFLLWAMANFTGCSFGICGKTVSSAGRNVITPLLQMTYLRQHYQIRYKQVENLLTVQRGNRENRFYIFGGKDESSYQLIQGITLAGVLLDEVALMPRSFVEQALARCSVEGAKFWFNCNPDGPEHWFYKEWILQAKERNALHLHFTMQDNPSLSEKTIARYESLYTGVFYARYIEGKWVIAEGKVYELDAERHITTDEPCTGDYYISVDYGTQNPCSMGLWCVGNGHAVRIAEYYHSGRDSKVQKTDEEYYAALEQLAGDRRIESVIIDPSAASFIATIRKHKRFSVRKAKNDVLNGIRTVASMLQNGVLQIHARCTDSIREFGLYAWDTKAKEDRPIKENDHAMDDIRYFCYTVLRRLWRWEDV